MNIAMTGATGYIGKHLSNYLTEKGGHRIIPLGRSMFREGMSGHLIQTLTHCDVIINLAGAPINKRWTPEYKQELFNSRIVVTHRIIRALNAVKTKPKLMISASAVGYYPPEVEADEYTRTRGDGFLSDLCYAWEKEAKHCPQPTRLVITRFGVVLSPDGGAMQQMLRPLQATKVATAIGPGTQSFPWIYNPQIQISAESETKRSIFREKDKTKRSKKESAQHSKSRNKSFVMTSVSAL